jgi:hypothetical protein
MVPKGIRGKKIGWALSSAASEVRTHALAGGKRLTYDEPASSSISCRFTLATKS